MGDHSLPSSAKKALRSEIQLCINTPSDNSLEFLEISLDSEVSSNPLKRQKIPQCKEFSWEVRALPAQLSLTIPIKNLTRYWNESQLSI